MTVTKEEKLEGGKRAPGVTTPPEGGWGWMVVAGCFLATICIRAVTRCVSMFFVEFQLHFERDYSTTAWIHSLIDSTTMLCAPLGGFLGNHISCRATVMLGGLLSSVGLVISSFASSLEHLYVCMGILTGLGFALSYTPAIAMVGRYFNERKALAYGIAMSGSGIGTFILAPAVQMLIEYYSWRGALLVLGGFVSNLCVCGALMRPLKPRGGERIWENNMANLEKDCMTTELDSTDTEQVPDDCSQVESKQLEINHLKDTQGLLIANGALKNFGLENSKLGQGNIALLSSPSLPDPSLTDRKIAECILFSNKLTETVLGKIKLSDHKLENGSTVDNLKLVEIMNLKNKAAEMDAKIEDSGLIDAKPMDAIDADHLDNSVSSPPEPLVNTKTSSRGCFCLKSREEFGFLMLPDFLILSVSILFMAYGCSAPVVYLVPYARSVGVGKQQAAFLMSIFGVSGIVGNITFGWITDRKCLKKYRMLSYMVAIGMEGLWCMFIPLLHSFPLLVLFSVVYGYFDGAYVALIPVVTSDVVGSTYLTSALGVVYFLHAIPYLVSPPIGGWLVDRTGNYEATFFLCGVSFIFSSVVLAAMLVRRCWRSRSNSAAQLSPKHMTAAAADQQGII
ncbi:monocarboxylate transporter 12-B-like [Symphorus nematophorus]